MKPTEILADAERVATDAIQLRRRIHRHPEIGLALPRTQAAVLEALDGLGLETRAGQRTTSVIARLTGGKPAGGAGARPPRPGPRPAAGDRAKIPVGGKGGPPAAPHGCPDPIPAAGEIVQAFQTLVTRRVNVFDPAVITIAKIEAGTTRNVIPETAHLLGTVRTVSELTRERVLEGVRRVADGIATAHGAE